jgi:hypothetical protein
MESNSTFSSALPIIVYARPAERPDLDWQEVDRGPGYFNIEPGMDIGVRLKGIDDKVLGVLVKELQSVSMLRSLDLAENRNITNEGLPALQALPQLTILNLSSCSISSSGLRHLKNLPHLVRLDLSYCNKLNDEALKPLDAMRSLVFVDIQGCLGIGQAALSRVKRRSLTIRR